MKKKVILSVVAAILTMGVLAGCRSQESLNADGQTTAASSAQTQAAGSEGEQSTATGGNKKIVVISKSYNNQFYQAAFKGAFDAAAAYGVEVTTNGPDAESNVSQQVEQVAAAINQKPDAIVLAACDPSSLEETLTKAKGAGIPVIGFDSGIPGDTTGAVVATAATDNQKAGANVASNLAEDKGFLEAVKKGTEDKPVVIGILAQDATSGSIKLRVDGFIEELKSKLEKVDGMAGAVDVSGQAVWTIPSTNKAKIKIVVTVPPSTSAGDIQSAANTIFSTDNLVAVFAANQDAVNGVISATNDATDLDKTSGKYKDIYVVGFDAGKTQKEAIKNGQFFGSVTQDPYQMGYHAVELAIKAANGETVADVDTGSKWYNSENMDSEDISILLYD